jgi:hypothetical protein
MDHFWSLVIGIVSSLVATALFLGFAEFFRRSLLPWYIDKLYRGVRIDGTWTLHMMDGKSIKLEDPEKMIFQLFQRGDRINGDYSYQVAAAPVANYRVIGVIRDMHFMATLEPKSNRLIDPAVCLFYIEHVAGALALTGRMTTTSKRGAITSSTELCFRRVAD